MGKCNPKRILLMTATGSYNLGDELILREEVAFLRLQYGQLVQLVVCTHDRNSSLLNSVHVDYITYFPHAIRKKPFTNILYFFQNLWHLIRSDMLVVGGGGILFDNEPGVSFRNILRQWCFRARVARFFGAKILYMGISLEVKNKINQPRLKCLFSSKDQVFVRDRQSADMLDELGIGTILIPDIVFSIPPEENPVLEKKQVGISVRGGFLDTEQEQQIVQIHDILVDRGYEPIFLAHTTFGAEVQNDLLFVEGLMQGKSYRMTRSIVETLELYPNLYAVIGMRFHAIVLAAAHAIPYLAFSYGPKTDALLDVLETPLEARLSAERFDFSQFEQLVVSYEVRRETLRKCYLDLHTSLKNTLESL